MTILVVDSDRAHVRALALQLRECGYRVLEATSFPDAQRLWDAEEPQVLIADVRLDAYNGLHLLIRARAVRPDVTALITSSRPDGVLAEETRRLGGTFLVKPLNVDDVVSVIEHREPAAARASRVPLAGLIYREFHDDEGAPTVATSRRAARATDADVAAGAARKDTLVAAMRHGRH